MTFDEWFTTGTEHGWISKIFCYTHDGVPLTAGEEEESETDLPCIAAVRLFGDQSPSGNLNYQYNHSSLQTNAD